MPTSTLRRLCTGALAWGAVFVCWIVAFQAAQADASTLGWVATVSTIFGEIRNIGIVCFAGACTIAGIELFFHRHLDRLGQTMAALGVGAGLIAVGAASSAGILGMVAAMPLTPEPVIVISITEALGEVVIELLYHGLTLGVFAILWLKGKRHVWV